jgi:hypothetical protein
MSEPDEAIGGNGANFEEICSVTSMGVVGRVFAGEPNRVRYKIVHPESEAANASASAIKFRIELIKAPRAICSQTYYSTGSREAKGGA